MKKIVSLISFLLSYYIVFAQSTNSIITLKDKNDLYLVGKKTYYLEDKEGKMTFEQVRQADQTGKFTLHDKDAFARPSTSSAFWFKITVQNQTNEDAWLGIGGTNAWYVDFYVPDSVGMYSKPHLTGIMRPENEKYYDIINGFWLPLNKAQDTQAKTYYLRITTERSFEAPLQVGTLRSLHKNKSINDALTAGFVGLMLIMILYNGGIYASTKEAIYGWYIGYLIFALLFSTFLNGYSFTELRWFHHNITIWQSTLHIFTGVFCIQYLQLRRQATPFYYLIISLLIILAPVMTFTTLLFGQQTIAIVLQLVALLFYATCIIAGSYVYFKKKDKSARFYLLGWIFFVLSLFSFIFTANGLLPYNPITRNAMYFGVALEVWLFSLALGDRMNFLRKEKKQATQDLLAQIQKNEKILQEQNALLEKKVQERTQALSLANYEVKAKNEALQTSEEELRQNMEELETSQELLKEQKQIIERAFENLNKQNQKVNDSIRYAQRIQNAILPHQDILATAFSEHFVIFKPKDVVSGDFYWYLEVENKKFLAIVDCTGHGVPGAFMSMIGNTLLYEIINAKRIFESNLILEELHLGILNAINKKDAKIQDGMDIALCCIEKQIDSKVKVRFSGAKRPLYYFSKQELSEIQADRKSIGQSLSSQVNYTSNEIILQAGDTLYMSTDGWVDSINPERKRFGSQQFKEMLLQGTNLSLKAQEEIFRHILEDYEQGTEQRDDVLLVGVKV